ncbi:hypothetical protein ABEB36_011708 [Hypothenemus hampei]|uniref:BHLH domain-containing protein n=1 Tax=Hypothenemus hampei TaxID=57062 RepID=A0ABD1E8X7_HYPHA
MTKPAKKTREKSKSRQWEKERRNRLNEYFNKLWELLPIYDASRPISKADILINAASTIKELDEKLKSLLTESNVEETSEERLKVSTDVIKKLEDRIKKLLLRNEQLTNLLRGTGIKIPSECGTVKKFKKPLKYSNAISKEKQKKVLQAEVEKENQVKGTKAKVRVKNRKPSTKARNQTRKQLLTPSNCVLLVSQPSLQSNPCLLISKPAGKLNHQTVLSNSLVIKTPANAKTTPIQTQLSRFPSGTLLLTEGSLLPIVPTPRPYPVLPTIFTNPIASPLPTLVVVTSKSLTNPNKTTDSVVKTLSSGHTLPVLRPRCNITRTTQVNKVPIPALTSRYNKHTCLDKKNQKVDKDKDASKSNVDKKKSLEKDNDEVAVPVVEQSSESLQTNHNENVDLGEKNGKIKPRDVSDNQEKVNDVSVCNHLNSEGDFSFENSSKVVETTDTDNFMDVAISKNETTQLNVNSYQTSRDTSVLNNNDFMTSKANSYAMASLSNNSSEQSNQDGAKHTMDVTLLADSAEKHLDTSSLHLNDNHDKTILPHEHNKDNLTQQHHQHQHNMNELKTLEMNLSHTELSNDIFASLSSSCQNHESTSPTAAFLLSFPLVSSGTKVAEVMGEENSESQVGTPNLLHIGTMDVAKPTQSYSDSLTPNLFDTFSFFNNKDCSATGFYNAYSDTKSKHVKGVVDGKFQGFPKNGSDPLDQTSNFTVNNAKEISYKNFSFSACASEKSSSLMQDFNGSDLFTFKPINSNYTSDNKSYNYTSKFNNSSNYSHNYKGGGNSSVNNQFTSNKHYLPAYSSGSTFGNSLPSDSSNINASYGDYNRKSFTTNYDNGQVYHHHHHQKDHKAPHQGKVKVQNKSHINWMTTPSTTTTKPDYFLPTFSNNNPSSLSSNTYFNSCTNEHFTKTDLSYGSYQRMDVADDNNRFSWSPSKMPQFLDGTSHAPSFVSSTLPTLVGDLALNTAPIVEQKSKKDNRRKSVICETTSGPSFLSVSQLVEENEPAKVVSRRSSGNRSKLPHPVLSSKGKGGPNKNQQAKVESGTRMVNTAKNTRSSYSAEALIGNNQERNSSCQKTSFVSSFLNENVVSSYFPSVETSAVQEAFGGSQNCHQAANSFGQNFQNNSYGTNNFIPTSYNFNANVQQDFMLTDNGNLFHNNTHSQGKDPNNRCNNYATKTFNKTPPAKEDNNSKKGKKRPLNDSNIGSSKVLPAFDIQFLSMSGNINSPVLPDDFHAPYLPPTTLYSCKNPLYPKGTKTEVISNSLIPPLPAALSASSRPSVQPSQISPSVNSAGTSLTNFNLSAIFPEINKGPVQDSYSQSRNKDYNSGSSKTFADEHYQYVVFK